MSTVLPSGIFNGGCTVESAELEAFRTEFGDRLGALEVRVDAVLTALEEIKLKLGIRPSPTLGPAHNTRLVRDRAPAPYRPRR
jgi:hypothetical protein